MPSEITHKSPFRFRTYLAWLAAMWVFGYVVGINDAASTNQPSIVSEPTRTVYVTPTP